jgi:type III secretory pathway lipoprotein EscJ
MLKIFSIIILIFLSSCREDLLSVASEVEANRILLSLRENEVDADKLFTKGSWVVKVESKNFTRSLDILEKKRIYYRTIFEASKESNEDIFSSREQKKARELEKISKELASTLLMFPSVIDAKVHLYRKQKDELESANVTESASVVLITDKEKQIDHENVKIIVSKGTGISPDSVYVIEKVSFYNEVAVAEPKIIEKKIVEESKYKMSIEYLFGLILFLVIFLLCGFIYFKPKRKFKKEFELVSQSVE